jgi:hypothetical protein
MATPMCEVRSHFACRLRPRIAAVPAHKKTPASCWGRETQYCSSFRRSLVAPPRRSCLLRSLEASCRRRSFAKATSPAQRILDFCRHLSPSRFPAIRRQLPGPKGLWRIGSARSLPPTSILLVEMAAITSAMALPRPGTKANPMPHAPDTRREAVAEANDPRLWLAFTRRRRTSRA